MSRFCLPNAYGFGYTHAVFAERISILSKVNCRVFARTWCPDIRLLERLSAARLEICLWEPGWACPGSGGLTERARTAGMGWRISATHLRSPDTQFTAVMLNLRSPVPISFSLCRQNLTISTLLRCSVPES